MEKEAVDNFKWLADTVPVGIAHMKYDGIGLKIGYANKGLYDILQCSKKEYEQKHNNYYNAVILPEDWEKMQQDILNCIENWTTLEREYSIRDINGRIGWRLMQAIPMKKEEDGCVWFQCSISNITTLKETERRLDSLVENFPGCILRVFYSAGNASLEYMSDGIKKLTGYNKEEFKEIFKGDTETGYLLKRSINEREILEFAHSGGKSIRKEICIPNKNGEKCWMEIRSSVVSKTEDSIVIQYVFLDINEQKEAEELLQKEQIRLEVVAGLSTDSIFEYNIAKDCMQYYNRKGLIIGDDKSNPVIEHYTERILDGAFIERLYHKDDAGKMVRLCEDFRTGKAEIYTEVRTQYEKGKYTWVAVEGKTITDNEGNAALVIGKISNIDERMRKEQELRMQSEKDPLTGLFNSQTAKQRVSEKLLEGVPEDTFIIIADIDNFTRINDSMGHLFGDALLCTFADLLREFFPEGFIGRVGGDEFLIYLEGIEDEKIRNRIRKLNKRLERIKAGAQDEVKVTASFGYTLCDFGIKNSLERLERQADTALLYLKEHTKGISMRYEDGMAVKSIERLKKLPIHETSESVIHTAGDMILYAHELFDSSKDLKGTLRLMSDIVTRFYHFQDILYIRRERNTTHMLYHWGEHDTKQFYENREIDYTEEKDWKRLLFLDRAKDHVVLEEDDFIGENVNEAKSMLSIRIDENGRDGYLICVDREKKRDWQEEIAPLQRLGEFVIRRYVQIKEQQHKEEEAEFRTKFDWVTGLNNYSNFMGICKNYIKEHPDQKLALVYTDFTNFQFINEVYGYSEGDKVLKEYARRLSGCEGILHGRVTADRFVSLFELRSMEELKNDFLKYAAEFCEEINLRYDQCKLGLVAGIAEVDPTIESVALNIDNANVARKSAKQDDSITDAVIYTHALRDELQKQREITATMADALEAGEFVTFLQPKVDMFTGKVIGAEALVRWIKPDGTRISPGEFVPIFEKNGFITQIDFEILRQVLNMQQELKDAGKPMVKISVNFSRKHQENPNYIRRLDELLASHTVPTEALEIEITESVFMSDLTPLTESIKQLKERGLSISIDDFGAGYSSLNVLSKVKADIIKLDRQFLLDVEMEKDNFTAEFLQLMIHMIKQLGFKVLAEGVETLEQVELLKNAGCHYAQGYYYAKPMSVPEFLEFIEGKELAEVE